MKDTLMKYSEFNKKMSGRNLEVKETGEKIAVYNKNGGAVVFISKYSMYSLDTRFNGFENLTEKEKNYVLYNANELAITPLEKREEEKRYRLKFVGHVDDGYEYLYILNGQRAMDIIGLATTFTESELEHMNETGFVREEVTE